MAFKPVKVTPTTVPTLDPFNDQIDIGGGVAATPTNSAALLNLVKNWVQAQPNLNGKATSARVTEQYVEVVTKTAGGLTPTSGTPVEDTVVVRFVANKPAVPGAPPDPVPYDFFVSDGAGQVVGVAYGNGLGDLNVSSASANGIDGWSPLTDPEAPQMLTFYSAAFVNGKYIVTGWLSDSQQVLFRSADGESWESFITTLSAAAFYTFAYGSGELVGVDKARVAGIARSIDMGATWTTDTSAFPTVGGFANNPLCVAHNGTVFCVLAKHATAGGGIYAYTSTDGITWGARNLTPLNVGASTNWATNPNFTTHGATFIIPVFQQGGAGWGLLHGNGTSWAVASLPAAPAGKPMTNGTNIVLSCFLDGTQVMVSDDNGATFSLYSTGAASSFDAGVWNGEKFIIYSSTDATRRYTSLDGKVWTEVAVETPGTDAITITQADIDAANDGGAVSFFWSAGLDPAYLTNPVEIVYPPVCNGYTDAYWDDVLTATFGRYNPSGPVEYVVASFNGKFFRWGDDGRGTWSDVFSDACKIRFAAGFDRFCNEMAYAFEGRRALSGNTLGPQVFFITAYAADGTPRRVALAHISANTPANLQLRSGAQYLNFVTGRLQADPSAQTCLRFSSWFQAWGNNYSRWEFHLAGMPTYGAGLQPYMPPSTLTPIGGGEGQDFVSDGTGYNLAPTSPFTFLVGGGFDAITAPPTFKQIAAGGFGEYTAPPLPVRVGGGFLEAGSSLQLYTSATAVTQHMGLPFTTKKG